MNDRRAQSGPRRERRGGSVPQIDTVEADAAASRRRRERPGTRVLRRCAYAVAGVVALGAVALTGLRLLLPELEYYRPEIERWVSRVTERQVAFESIDAHWRGWTPVFRLEGVRLAGGGPADAPAAGDATDDAIRLASLSFSIDPLESLRSGALQPREITASGASLAVVRRSDGSFSVKQLGELAPAGPGAGDRLAKWVSSQPRISLFASRIVWIEERLGMTAVPLNGLTLHLEHEGDRHRVSGSFEPPRAGRVDFAMEVAGDPLSSSWSASTYLSASDVDVARLGLDAERLGVEAVSGVVSATAWSTWTGGRFVEAQGTVRARTPGVMQGGIWRQLDEASASFKVVRTPEGWTIDAHDLAVATPDGSWPRSRVGAKWTPPGDGRDGAVVLSAEYVRIEDLVALIATPGAGPPANPVLNALFEAAPSGAIEDLHVSAPLAGRIDLARARARGRFTETRLQPGDWPISVEAASGWFEANDQGLVTTVESGVLHVNAPRWLAMPLRGEAFTGTFAALPSPDGVRVRLEESRLATPAGIVTATGSVLAPRGEGKPELSAAFSLGRSKVDAAHALLADGVLPEPVLRWLRAAMPDGDIRGAQVLVHGDLSGMPWDAGGGTFEAVVDLALPTLRYANGWPELTEVSATVRFDGPRLDARVESGRIFESTVREATIAIEDVGAAVPVLEVAGRVEGDSADAVRYLSRSPLRARFSPAIDTYAVRGAAGLDLRLTRPLKGERRSTAVEGEIALVDNRIDGPGLGRGAEAVNGTIAFRGGTIESDALSATWLREPLRAVIGASPDPAHAARLSIDGRVTRRMLATWLDERGLSGRSPPGGSGLLGRLDGEAPWSVVVDIPRAGTGRAVELRAATELAGISLDLPPPFGKASGATRTLRVETSISPGKERIVGVRFADLASAAFGLVPRADGLRLARGAVRLGPGDSPLPDASGVTVQGRLPALDAGTWYELLQSVRSLRTSRANAPPAGQVLDVSIEADSVTAIGTRFPATRIRAARDEDGSWRIELDGRGLAGTIRVPLDLDAGPIVTDFTRFVFDPEAVVTAGERRRLDPRTLPALSFSTRSFVLGELDLGRVAFSVVPAGPGMQLERLAVQADSFRAEATGSWSRDGAEERTEFNLRMHGDKLGDMLDSLGFDGSVVAGGTTDISLRGSWTGAPADFELERLAGVMHFLSTDGRLTRIEPGVTGRVFGLLTITSLPRRLILDFSDLFKDGFEYDRTEGSFALEKGNAYTEDLFIEGDTARFEIVGRTGLEAEDYDQLVTVIPKISSTLPLVPLWLAQKILDRNVFDKAFAYQYMITGPWSQPSVELVKTRSRDEDAQN